MPKAPRSCPTRPRQPLTYKSISSLGLVEIRRVPNTRASTRKNQNRNLASFNRFISDKFEERDVRGWNEGNN